MLGPGRLVGHWRLWLIATIFCATANSTRANGYGEAKRLILEADKLLQGGDERGFLKKLDETLKMQTTVDRKQQEYGYAGYVHLRLAQHWQTKGKRSRAKIEIRKALAVKSGLSFVDEGFLVNPFHPFIREHFPELSGFKTKTTKSHMVAPDAIHITGSGPFAIIAGSRRFYRLERATNQLAQLHALTNDSTYRVAVHPSGNQLAFVYERAKFIFYMQLDPFRLERIKRPALPDGLFLDTTGTQVVLFSERRVYVAQAGAQAAFEKRHEIPGKWLHKSGYGGTYLRPLPEARCTHYGCDADAVVAYRVSDGAEAVVFELRDPDENRFLRIGWTYDPDYALIIRDQRHDQRVIVHRYSTGETFAVSLPAPASFGKGGSGKQVVLAPNADALVYLRGSAQSPELIRVDLDGTVTQRVQLPPAGKLDRWSLMGLDVLTDGTVLIHVGDTILVVRGTQVKSVDLRPFSKKPKPEWAGSNALFSDPDELFVGIEKGGSRYFMKVPIADLLR